MSNAKELKQIPISTFPVDLINILILKYNTNKDIIPICAINEAHLMRQHNQTIKTVLSQFGIDTDDTTKTGC
jgi:hypothetical protein